MADRWAVAMAAAAALGALHPSTVPLVAGVALVAGALACRWALVLCLGVGICVSALATRALDGLDGLEEAAVHGPVTLVTDPRPSGAGLRADARMEGHRVELRAGGAAARELSERLAGEVLVVRGRLIPLAERSPWEVSRHLAGRVTVLAVERWEPGHAVARLANGLRRTLTGGAASLSPTHRALFTGLVFGDDRAQPAAVADDFLGAGMTHLLAVSGQNVAFCLVLASPVLRRLGLWGRLLGTLCVIATFGVMTRFEPSVLRASAMAALAATVVTVGHPISRVRVIALATSGLLLVDPLLVHSVGFRLSVAAAAAIVVLAAPLSGVLRGPRPLREALAVTLAAQLGVAPVLLATFGPMPVASIPANLLAVPVAGLVMMWGITGGLVAGLAGGSVAGLVHLPTVPALRWLEVVAAGAAGAPLGELHLWHTLVVAVGLGGALALRGGPRGSRWSAVALAAAAAALVAAVLQANAPPALRSAPMVGLVRWHSAGADVVVLGGVGGRASLGARPVLEAMRREGVRSIDLLVVADAHVPAGTLAALVDGHPVGDVLAHPAATAEVARALRRPVTRAPPVDAVVDVGALRVRLVPATDRVVVDARPAI